MKVGSIPTVGLVRAELGYFASTTEAGRLNTVLNVAYEYIDQLEIQIKHLNSEVARLEKETQQ
jgi:outer membrane murein-binding lipoprotein Lpp